MTVLTCHWLIRRRTCLGIREVMYVHTLVIHHQGCQASGGQSCARHFHARDTVTIRSAGHGGLMQTPAASSNLKTNLGLKQEWKHISGAAANERRCKSPLAISIFYNMGLTIPVQSESLILKPLGSWLSQAIPNTNVQYYINLILSQL